MANAGGKSVSSFGVSPISTHSWNAEGDHIAIAKNQKEVEIYKSTGSGANRWTTSAVLDQHDLRVTGIDWAPKTNRIVTCSADRNAYVWNKEVSSRLSIVCNRIALLIVRSDRDSRTELGSTLWCCSASTAPPPA